MDLINYYVITMKARNGKTLYLDLTTGEPKWTHKRDNACWWSTYRSAEIFGEKWFTSFTGWSVQEMIQGLDEIIK